MRVCVLMRVGTRDPDFKYILSSLNSFLSFPLLEELEMMIFDICLSYKMVCA